MDAYQVDICMLTLSHCTRLYRMQATCNTYTDGRNDCNSASVTTTITNTGTVLGNTITGPPSHASLARCDSMYNTCIRFFNGPAFTCC